MAPAGVIEPSRRWKHSGHHEIQKPQSRYGIIDLLELNASLALPMQRNFRKPMGAFGHRSFFMLRGIPSSREYSTNQPKRLQYGLVNPALWSPWLTLF